MGVRGLWKLLQPAALPIPLDSLTDKVLAIDASIWMHAFLRAMRTKDSGDLIRGAHLIGFLRRLCKLLFYRIKPVFVFDGAGVPTLKRDVLQGRQRKREGAESSVKRTARLLVQNQLKAKALEFVEGAGVVDGPQAVPVRNAASYPLKKRAKDAFELAPDKEHCLLIERHGDERVLSAEELQAFIDQHLHSPTEAGPDVTLSSSFRSLPLNFQHDLILSMKLQSRLTSSERLEALTAASLAYTSSHNPFASSAPTENRSASQTFNQNFETPSKKTDFSNLQIQTLVQRNALTQRAFKFARTGGVDTERVSKGSLSKFKGKRGDQWVQNEERRRIVGSRNASYVLVKDTEMNGVGWLLKSSEKESSKKFVEDETKTSAAGYANDAHVCTGEASHDDEPLESVLARIEDMEAQEALEKSMKNIAYGSVNPSVADRLLEEAPAPVEAIDSEEDEYWEVVGESPAPSSVSSQLPKFIASTDADIIEADGSTENYDRLLAETLYSDNISVSSSLSPELADVLPSIGINGHSNVFGAENTFPERDLDSPELERMTVPMPIVDDDFLEPADTDVMSAEKERNFVVSMDTAIRLGNNEEEVSVNGTELKPTEVTLPFLLDIASEEMVETKKYIDENNMSLPVGASEEIAHERNIAERLKTAVPDASETVSGDNDTSNEERPVAGSPVERSNEPVAPLNLPSLAELDSEAATLHTTLRAAQRDADSFSPDTTRDIQMLLTALGIPYLTAPGEAEAQCATLYLEGFVDGVATDDADVFLFGGDNVYRHLFSTQHHVELYTLEAIKKAFEGDESTESGMVMDREAMVGLAMLSGGDYTEGVGGVGPITALEVGRVFEGGLGPRGLRAFKQWCANMEDDTDDVQFEANAFAAAWKKKMKKASLKWDFPASFPDERVRDAYLNPLVERGGCDFSWGVPQFEIVRDLMAKCAGWSWDKTNDILAPLQRELAKTNASSGRRRKAGPIVSDQHQPTLHAYYEPAKCTGVALHSKRAKRVLGVLRDDAETTSGKRINTKKVQPAKPTRTSSRKKPKKAEM